MLYEVITWDFKTNSVADFLMKYYGFDASLIADIKPTFSEQGRVNAAAAKELGLKEGVITSYSIHYTKLYEFCLRNVVIIVVRTE